MTSENKTAKGEIGGFWLATPASWLLPDYVARLIRSDVERVLMNCEQVAGGTVDSLIVTK